MKNIFTAKREEALTKLKQEIYNCRRCSLATDANPCAVFGEGPINANIMSVSEAPGADEDREKRPYVGRAGKYWEGILASVGWQREFIYTCNVLKGRPPNNKYNPDLSEADACKSFLDRQISIIQPKLILAFGRLAGYGLRLLEKHNFNSALRPLMGIQKQYYQTTNILGQQINILVVWLYHPSYLMRSNKEAACIDMFNYLSEAKEALNGLDKR